MSEELTRILIIAGDSPGRLVLSRALEQEHLAVDIAENDSQAFERLHAGIYAAVLLSLDTAGLDAIGLLDRLRAEASLRSVPVIVVGGDATGVERALNAGAVIDLPNGFSPLKLRSRLRAAGLGQLGGDRAAQLRQTEKFATLGRLTAGLAHELNNPAAAAQRGAIQLRDSVSLLQRSFVRLGALKLTTAQLDKLLALDGLARERAATPSDLESLSRNDRESELEDWLVDRSVPTPWELTPSLVNLGYDVGQLAQDTAGFTPAQLPAVVGWMSATYQIYTMLEELAQGTDRMGTIVRALKSYSYANQEKRQPVNVNEGLDSTLVMLRSKLRSGVVVRREYGTDLPPIQGYGGELNQVWTNLIDNAIDAMDGHGEIVVRTRHDADWVIVEIEDNGPGIPPEIQSRIFDQFFTTKPQGIGTGQGLHIGQEIIVHKHKGKISVVSHPGQTRFEIRLPITIAEPA